MFHGQEIDAYNQFMVSRPETADIFINAKKLCWFNKLKILNTVFYQLYQHAIYIFVYLLMAR